jgi:putative ABC transport system permease protein
MPCDTCLWLRARNQSPEELAALRGQIPRVLAAAGLANTYAETLQQFLQGPNPLPIVSSLFDAMVILVALVGLLGLAHTLTESVLERRLEIGMVRSLGATGRRVGSIFLIEGVALALFAWGWGILLGLPAGAGLLQALGTFLGPVDLTFQPLFLVTTLGLVLLVACLASAGPGRLARADS